jgi:hypothetical protein
MQLDQAERWERLTVAELEAYFDACTSRMSSLNLLPCPVSQSPNFRT